MARKYIILEQAEEPRYRGGIRFSLTEIWHIAVSMIVLIFAFTFLFSGVIYRGFDMDIFKKFLAASVIGVSTEFLLHELAHKFTAQKFGCWSEYRYTESGLVITLISGIIGFLIAAPGVVYHSGSITKEQEGKISAAGPFANIGLGALFIAFFLVLPAGTLISFVCAFVAFINIWVGGFNLVPFPPLDGSKIWKWSIPMYILMWAMIILMGVFMYPYVMTLF